MYIDKRQENRKADVQIDADLPAPMQLSDAGDTAKDILAPAAVNRVSEKAQKRNPDKSFEWRGRHAEPKQVRVPIEGYRANEEGREDAPGNEGPFHEESPCIVFKDAWALRVID